jgi:hypothetical protein
MPPRKSSSSVAEAGNDDDLAVTESANNPHARGQSGGQVAESGVNVEVKFKFAVYPV